MIQNFSRQLIFELSVRILFFQVLGSLYGLNFRGGIFWLQVFHPWVDSFYYYQLLIAFFKCCKNLMSYEICWTQFLSSVRIVCLSHYFFTISYESNLPLEHCLAFSFRVLGKSSGYIDDQTAHWFNDWILSFSYFLKVSDGCHQNLRELYSFPGFLTKNF